MSSLLPKEYSFIRSLSRRIFVHSFAKPKNIRLVGFDIRFTTTFCANVHACHGLEMFVLRIVAAVQYHAVVAS